MQATQVRIKSAVEQETKLHVDGRFRLPSLDGERLSRRLLTSTYYDTSNYRLARVGITLRHRTQKRKGVWQLKLPLDGARREIEISGRAGIPPAAFTDLLVVHLQGEELIPAATLRTARTGILARGDQDSSAEVVLDVVSLLKDGHVVHSFREVEIERKTGDDHLLTQLEKELRKAGAEKHDGRPKLFRALDIPPPPPIQPPAVEAPTIEHLRFVLRRHVEVLRAHDPGTRLGGVMEDLHKMRVSTRQMRTILRAARPLLVKGWAEPLRTELGWLGELLGSARDLDVQIKYFREEAAALDVRDRRRLERFIARLCIERDKIQQALLTDLQSPRYLELVRKLMQVADDPPVVISTVTLCDIAAKEFKKLRKAMRKADVTQTDSQLHRLRIKAKRARYAAELAETSRGKPADQFIAQSRAFQDLLGQHHDAVVAESHVRKFSGESSSVRTAFVAGQMVERQRQRRQSARSALKTQWKKLKKRGEKAWS